MNSSRSSQTLQTHKRENTSYDFHPTVSLTEPHSKALFSASQIFQLQQSIGNQAVTQLLKPTWSDPHQTELQHTLEVSHVEKSTLDHEQPIQRVLEVEEDRYTHGSKRGVNDLFDHIVAPHLEKEGFKTYGIKSRLVEYIKNFDTYFNDYTEFLDDFMPWLEQQTRRVRGDRTTPVLKKFGVNTMSRPKWSNALKEKVNYEDGDNIRHVIRNATLKRALEIEFNRIPILEEKKDRFEELANSIGIDLKDHVTIDVIAREIYKKVYLNEANLFAGEGPYNQIIGFAADRVKQYGEYLLALENDFVAPLEIAENVKALIREASGQTRFGFVNPVTIDLCEIIDTVVNQVAFEGYTIDFVEAEDMGDLIIDIGLSFGFDLIDGKVPEDQENVGQRQGLLFQIESELQQFIASNGQVGDIMNIFSRFLAITRN